MDDVGSENGNGHIREAADALKLPGATPFALMAESQGLTPRQAHVRFLETLRKAAEAGDLEAARELRSFAIGPLVGLDRARSSKAMHRRIVAALSVGWISAEEAADLDKQRRARREEDTSKLDRRVRALEMDLISSTAIRSELE